MKIWLRLQVGYEQAKIVQEYQTIGMLLSQALGGKSSTGKAAETFEEAEAQFGRVFGGKAK